MAKQPETKVKFSIFNKDFNKGISEMSQESTKLRKEFKLQEEQLKQNGSASDLLKNKIGSLSAEQEITKQKIKATADQLAKAKTYYGENSNEANKLSNKLLDLQISEQKLENAIGQTKAELKKQGQAMNSAQKDAKSLGQSLDEAGRKAKDIGGSMSTTATPALGAFGIAVGKIASDFDGAQGQIQAQIGVTAEEAEKLSGVAQSIWKKGFGENIGEVTNNLALVKQNIQGISDEALPAVTEQALILQKVFGAEVTESTRTAAVMMKNFGIDSTTAMDLMTVGFQKGGNFSDELLDTMREYSPQFSTMGHSAEDMMNILISGAEAGAWNLDKVGDAVKEFNIRAKDGSKTTAEGFQAIGLDAEQMGAAIAEGGTKGEQAFQATIAALAGMEDPVARNAAGVALFGTQWEDLETDVVAAMASTTNHVNGFEGATAEAGAALEDTFGMRLSSTFRDLQQALLPVGEAMLDFAIGILPQISSAAQTMATWFSSLSPVIQKVIVIIGALITILGPLFVVFGFVLQGIMPIVNGFMTLWSWVSKLAPLFNILRVAFLAITGPVGLIILAVVALIAVFVNLWNTSDAFRNFFINLWNNILTVLTSIWNGIMTAAIFIFNALKTYFTTVLNSYKLLFTTIWNAIKIVVSTVLNSIKSTITTIWNGIKSISVSVWNGIKSAITTIVNALKGVITNVWNGIKSTISTVANGIKSAVSTVWNNIKSNTSSSFNSIKSTASSVWNGIKNAITKPIESAKTTVLNIIDTIEGAFSRMKITIPKPKMPKVSVAMKKNNMGIPYPDFNVSWHKTGGVFTRPVVAGNAGFGDVEEGIVPFEGQHAMKIAKLIAAAQSKISNVSNGLADRAEATLQQSINMTLVSQLDGYEVARNQYKYIDGIMSESISNDKRLGGVK